MRRAFLMGSLPVCALLVSTVAAQPTRDDILRGLHGGSPTFAFAAERAAFLNGWRASGQRPAHDPMRHWLPGFLAAARKARGKPVAVPSLEWLVRNDPTPTAEHAKTALATLVDHHAWDRALLPLLEETRALARKVGRGTTLRALGRLVASTTDAEIRVAARGARAFLSVTGRNPSARRLARAGSDWTFVRRFFADVPPPTVDAAGGRVEIYRGRNRFEARLARPLRVVGFDDIATGGRSVAFEADRYAESHGVVITGQDGQFADRSFGWPKHFVPFSGPNMYAPGPKVARKATEMGGNTTTVTFVAGGKPARVAGFGAWFLDADHPNVAKSSLAAFDADGQLLARDDKIVSPDGGRVFLGFVTVDQKGEPAARIARVVITNGDEWPERDGGEGVALDDLVFPPPQR